MTIRTLTARALLLAGGLCVVAAPAGAQRRSAIESQAEAETRAAVVRELGDPRDWGGDSNAINFVSKQADLNGDGVPEVLVWIPTIGYGGTGGYPLLIFRRDGRRLRLLANIEPVWTPLYVLRSSRRGWRDLAVGVGGGGMEMQYMVYRHDGKRYPDEPQPIDGARIRGVKLFDRDWRGTVFGPLPGKR